MIFVTGGAGFIGSNFILDWLCNTDEPVINLDKLTYAGNIQNLAAIENDRRHIFVQGDICDQELIHSLLTTYQPRALIHFAAESHVDNSIIGPDEFVRTNVYGTFTLLDAFKAYWKQLDHQAKTTCRFLHISTDEVFGSLSPDDAPFTEFSPYAPNSPYSASKAASDHLVRAYHHTYGLPTLTINCSNNYGPYQFPEKLIPLMIVHALADKDLPIYGDGQNIRDWLHVKDHCSAIRTVLGKGNVGENYAIGGGNQYTNIGVVKLICDSLDEMKPRGDKKSYKEQMIFVQDRPGHDRRYAINSNKTKSLGWTPLETFETGLRKTVQWYLDNQAWLQKAVNRSFT